MPFQVLSFSGFLICLAFFLAGIVDSVCGGGGLITLPTFMAVGFPVHMISGTNQCSTFLGGATAFVRYLRGGHVHWRTALPAIPITILGAFLGARLNLILPEEYLEILLIVLLPVVAIAVLIKKNFGEQNKVDTLNPIQILINAVFIGLIVGGYQGFYAAGAGTFFMLSFAVLDKLDLITASGNTKLIALCSNITAGITYAFSGAVLWQMVLAATFFNIAGNYIGSGLAMTKGAKVIRPMLIGIVAVLIIRLILSLV